MKKSILFIIFILLLVFVSCKKQSNNELTVYCYDSFVGDWGPGNSIAADFEKETGIHVNLISCSGSVQLYSKIIYEGNKCSADLVIGLPDSINIDNNLFTTWTPSCKEQLINYDSNEIIPFNYGVFAFIYNENDKSINAPTTLFDLSKPEYKNKFIIIDPRTSSVGLGLLKWSYYALGNDFENWWTSVLDNALTVADSWSSGYGLFTEGEAPLVISYSTSPVYHLMYEETDQYKALEFSEGHIITEEYLAIMKSSKKQEEAKKFCEYVLTKGQTKIAVANTMFPANKTTTLPDEYNKVISPSIIEINKKDFISKEEELINKWTNLLIK